MKGSPSRRGAASPQPQPAPTSASTPILGGGCAAAMAYRAVAVSFGRTAALLLATADCRLAWSGRQGCAWAAAEAMAGRREVETPAAVRVGLADVGTTLLTLRQVQSCRRPSWARRGAVTAAAGCAGWAGSRAAGNWHGRRGLSGAAGGLGSEARWWRRCKELEEYKEEHGDCLVPRGYKPNPALGRWADMQRELHRKGALKAEQVEALEALGSDRDARKARWQRMYEQLAAYKEEHGDCLVPHSYKPNPALGWWVYAQRKRYKTGELQAEQVEALEALGFDQDPVEAHWHRMYEQLAAYKEEHGDCLVPERDEVNPALTHWVIRQRGRLRNGDLSPEREAALRALGFEWDPKEAKWQRMYAHLKAYRALTGHCLVPVSDGALGMWVGAQRYKKRHGEMLPHRQRLLEGIGFVWRVRTSRRLPDTDQRWQEWLALLRDYKAQHGHCRMPRRQVEDGKKLGHWIGTQRVLWRKGRLAPERQEALQDIGFVWDPKEEAWQAMYEELCAFKERSGHCLIGKRDKKNKKLGTWAGTQRERYNKGRLAEARLAKLEALGFPWRFK
eukprot:jgi/Tetstr1/429318/TSEL_019236.t1